MTKKKIEKPIQTPGPVQPRRKGINYDPFARRKTHPIRDLFGDGPALTEDPQVASDSNPMATHEVETQGYPQG